MVKHTQIIRRQQLLPTNYLSVFDHFVGLVLNGLTQNLNKGAESCFFNPLVSGVH